VSVDVDCGHVFGTGPDQDSWFGGLCLGKQVTKHWELDAEVHVNADEGLAGRSGSATSPPASTSPRTTPHASAGARPERPTGQRLADELRRLQIRL